MRWGWTASRISRTLSTISANVSALRLSGMRAVPLLGERPAMFTQQRALTRSASASRSWQRANPAARTASSRLSGFASQAPISAIEMPAASAAAA